MNLHKPTGGRELQTQYAQSNAVEACSEQYAPSLKSLYLAPIKLVSDGTESAFSVDGIIEQKKRNYGLNGARVPLPADPDR